MKVAYVDFWPDFDENCNWFNLILKETFGEVEVVSPEESDMTFCSCFGDKVHFVPRKIKKVLYLGENARPVYGIYDYSLSFDYDSYENRNFRLPHWMLYINFWDEPNFKYAPISLDQLYKHWKFEDIYSRKDFCNIVIGNPVENRLQAFRTLSEYKPVHGYGKVFNKPIDDKMKLLENYRFNICFENSIYPGYVTEKLLQAKVGGCIPIYYGDYFSAVKDFNPFFIDAKSYSGKELLNLIKHIDSGDETFEKLVNVPLFKEEISLNPLKEFLVKIYDTKI